MTVLRHIKRTALLAVLLIFASLAIAEPQISTETQAGIDAVNATNNYGQDFGQKVINWASYGTDTPVYGEPSLASTISRTLNFIALAMMAWLTVLGAATYVIQSANKGIPGGQVISSFWAPIRVSFAVLMLVPLTSGFSTLQYGVITVAEKGNATANMLMKAGLDYLYDYGVYKPPLIPDGRTVMISLIRSEVCKQYINSYTNTQTVRQNEPKAIQLEDRIVSRITYAYKEAPSQMEAQNNPRNDYCGSVAFSIGHDSQDDDRFVSANTFHDTDEYTAHYGGPPLIAAEQVKVLAAARVSAEKIAKTLLSDESALRNLQATGNGQSTYEKAVNELNGTIGGLGTDLNTALREFNVANQKTIASAVNKINDQRNKNDKTDGGWREQTIAMGWPALGSIFWQINIQQSEINKLASSMEAVITNPSLDDEWLADDRFLDVLARVDGLQKAYVAQHPSSQSVPQSDDNKSFMQPAVIPSLSSIADAGAEGDGWIDNTKSVVYAAVAGTMRSAMYKNSPDDLIINMQYFGSAVGTTAEGLFWAKAIATATVKTIQKAVKDDDGDASKDQSWFSGKLAWVMKKIASPAVFFGYLWDEISGLINYLLIAMIIVGFTLGIVLPTIPLTQWLMGVISWMLFFVECLLVSPMWMAAHGTAEKEGWGSEHTRQGYMLMIGLFLNPILRVAGFFMIFLLLRPVAWMTAWFFDYVQGVIVSGFTLFFFIFGGVIVAAIFGHGALVRLFGLPSEVFERGLRWINGGQEVTGDSGAEKEVRSNYAAFVGKSETAAFQSSKGLPTSPRSPKPDNDQKA